MEKNITAIVMILPPWVRITSYNVCYTKLLRIFGLFDDSLPDGWGLLLMDRSFRNQGFDIEQITALDRLAFLGNATMGALVYEPASGPERFTDLIDLKKLSDQSRQILEGKSVDVLP